MDDIDVLIKSGDAEGLQQKLASLVVRNHAKLLATYRYLESAANASSQIWLKELLQSQSVQDLWFIAYCHQLPEELLCAYEYDFFSRHKSLQFDRVRENDVIYGMIDSVLGINYANEKGPKKSVTGIEFFKKSSVNERMSDKLWDTTNPLPLFFRPLLRPPLEEVSEWTLFHLKLRRIVFLLISYLLDHFLNDSTSIRAIGRFYISEKLAKMMNDETNRAKPIRDLLKPSEKLLTIIGESVFQSTLERAVSEVEKSMDFQGARDQDAFLPILINSQASPVFIYESSPEMQQIFFRRISAL